MPQLYTQGDPTNDEQYLMQLLNRARMDPVGEGQRLAAYLRLPENADTVRDYQINVDQVISDFAALPAVPPLAFDPDLLATARAHSADMAAHNFESHTGSDGSTAQERVEASGYVGIFECENAAEGVGFDSLDTIHAGYFVDWGNPDLGHRVNSMNGGNAENAVGIGLADGPEGSLSETEDYGGGFRNSLGVVDRTHNGHPAELTGVVYDDANGNGQYDPGEGMAGVTVTMDGGKYYALTSASGGYALPLINTDGSYAAGLVPLRMTFPDGGVFTATTTITYYNGNNGLYLASVEWDATKADDQMPAFDPSLPHFRVHPLSLAAGGTGKVKVYRPANSDLSQPYTATYKAKGSAVAGVDYAVLPLSITVPVGEMHAKITVSALESISAATTLKLKLPGVARGGTARITISP